jgi:hypothetical protein
MAIDLKTLRRGTVATPMQAMLYAPHGIGKTSFAAYMPEPIFLRCEDGLGMLDVATFDLLRTYDDLMEAFGALFEQEHSFQTVVVDSLDWLEPIIWAEACRRNGWGSIEDPGYGKGYIAAASIWREVLAALSDLRAQRKMGVMLLAHVEVKEYKSPDTDPYDRYQPKLHKMASAIVQENVDAIFFMNYRVSLVRTDPKDKNSKQRGVGGGQRVLYTEERPAFLAKRRWPMPDAIDLPEDPAMMWPTVAQYIPFYNTGA